MREEEAHDLEDPLAVPRVHVADVAQLLAETAWDAGLLESLPKGGLGRFLARIDEPLRQRPGPLALPLRTYGCKPPTPLHPADEHDSGGELAAHRDFVTPFGDVVTGSEPGGLNLAWRNDPSVLGWAWHSHSVSARVVTNSVTRRNCRMDLQPL